ncbi:MAG: thiamine diphosphokinase [Bacteroidales bacterium]|jgi:thiamine pyrophosphokinase|nr:thiamine diphosphokinase [Bacteroidales bacterium]
MQTNFSTVILADGIFPTHSIPLNYIRNADRIICCDGSVQKLIDFGLEPYAIAGDIDSLSIELARRYADRIFRNTEQETNDLTKAVSWCIGRGFNNIVIAGATGKREDHTIGNISLLAEYCRHANVIMATDTGIFKTYYNSFSAETFPGQQVSILSIGNDTEITSAGLKYPLNSTKLTNWWMGTLNEALGNVISLDFKSGRVIVFFKFMPEE